MLPRAAFGDAPGESGRGCTAPMGEPGSFRTPSRGDAGTRTAGRGEQREVYGWPSLGYPSDMASDIGLVLKSEHRDLLILADRCGRTSRGFQDPAADLRRRLSAHLSTATEEVYSALPATPEPGLLRVIDRVTSVLEDEGATGEVLADVARDLVAVEKELVVPPLLENVPIAERRRMGKVFRIRRDSALNRGPGRPHRQLSQSELYEQARRAGIEHRSRMTLAQLQEAVDEAHRRHGGGFEDAG